MCGQPPIGTQDFKEIGDRNLYYVDKTEIISQIVNICSKVWLFTRPRCFGKSLNLSTVNAFFNLKYEGNTWFDGLKVSQHKECDRFKNRYPVIYFDFKNIYDSDTEVFLQTLADRIAQLYSRYPELRESSKPEPYYSKYYQSATDSGLNKGETKSFLLNLAVMLREHYGTKPIILIDEYDNPIHHAFGNDNERDIVKLIGDIFSTVLKSEDNFEFAVLTGVMQISKESIFSGLNNLEVNNAFGDGSDGSFGFTNDEVKQICADYGHPEKYGEAKEWYDGYRFGNTDVYNPWSILNYVRKKFKPASYWAGTSRNDIIPALLNRADQETLSELTGLFKGGYVEKSLDPAIAISQLYSDTKSFYSVMVMSGYLNAVPNGSMYRLSIPNKEMFRVFGKTFLDRVNTDLFDIMSDMADALVSGDSGMLSDRVEKFLNIVVGNRVLEHEKEYQALLGGAFCILAKRYEIKIDMEAGNGFCDLRMVSLNRNNPHVCIEFKKVKSETQMETAASEALEQIKNRKYTFGLKGDCILYGIAFHVKTPVIVSERVVLD